MHMRPRVQRAPGLPCALFFLGAELFANLGRRASREREGVFAAGSPHERSDMREPPVPDIASLIRATSTVARARSYVLPPSLRAQRSNPGPYMEPWIASSLRSSQ
jgi:hypothetical protein